MSFSLCHVLSSVQPLDACREVRRHVQDASNSMFIAVILVFLENNVTFSRSPTMVTRERLVRACQSGNTGTTQSPCRQTCSIQQSPECVVEQYLRSIPYSLQSVFQGRMRSRWSSKGQGTERLDRRSAPPASLLPATNGPCYAGLHVWGRELDRP